MPTLLRCLRLFAASAFVGGVAMIVMGWATDVMGLVMLGALCLVIASTGLVAMALFEMFRLPVSSERVVGRLPDLSALGTVGPVASSLPVARQGVAPSLVGGMLGRPAIDAPPSGDSPHVPTQRLSLQALLERELMDGLPIRTGAPLVGGLVDRSTSAHRWLQERSEAPQLFPNDEALVATLSGFVGTPQGDWGAAVEAHPDRWAEAVAAGRMSAVAVVLGHGYPSGIMGRHAALRAIQSLNYLLTPPPVLAIMAGLLSEDDGWASLRDLDRLWTRLRTIQGVDGHGIGPGLALIDAERATLVRRAASREWSARLTEGVFFLVDYLALQHGLAIDLLMAMAGDDVRGEPLEQVLLERDRGATTAFDRAIHNVLTPVAVDDARSRRYFDHVLGSVARASQSASLFTRWGIGLDGLPLQRA